VNQLVFTHDKTQLLAATNPDILFYDTDYTSEVNYPAMKFVGHAGNVNSVGFSQEGRWIFSSSEDKTVKIWDFRGAKGCQRSYNFGSEVNSVVLHPDQVNLICGAADGSVYIINLMVDKISARLKVSAVSDEQIVRSVSVSPNGKLIAAATDSGTVDVWKDSELVTTLEASDTYILKCLFSPDGNRLATTSADSTAKLWSTTNWTLDKVLEGHKEWVWDCCYSADSNYLLTGGSDKSALLWEIDIGIPVKRYQGHVNTISAVALIDTIDNLESLKPKKAVEAEIIQTVTKGGRVIKRVAAPSPSGSPAPTHVQAPVPHHNAPISPGLEIKLDKEVPRKVLALGRNSSENLMKTSSKPQRVLGVTEEELNSNIIKTNPKSRGTEEADPGSTKDLKPSTSLATRLRHSSIAKQKDPV